MKIEIFNLCDFASYDGSGKLNVIGVFDTIWAREAPFVYDLCTLAIRIRFEKLEEGVKKLKISFVDADGKSILPVMEPQVLAQVPPNMSSSTVHVVSMMSQTRFPSFGDYSVHLAVEGRQEASTPLWVRQNLITPPHFQRAAPSA